MKIVRVLGRILLVSAITLSAANAMGESSYQGQPLRQVEFTRLVPITYPLATTRFTALKPTSFPVIQPGVARVHIIETLVRPMEQPLLRTIEIGSSGVVRAPRSGRDRRAVRGDSPRTQGRVATSASL